MIVVSFWVWLFGVCLCGCCEFVGVLVRLWVWLLVCWCNCELVGVIVVSLWAWLL